MIVWHEAGGAKVHNGPRERALLTPTEAELVRKHRTDRDRCLGCASDTWEGHHVECEQR